MRELVRSCPAFRRYIGIPNAQPQARKPLPIANRNSCVILENRLILLSVGLGWPSSRRENPLIGH